MKTLLLFLLLALSPLALANGQSSSSSSTLAAINKLIQEQKVALTDALAARNQAEADRKAAIEQATAARTEVAVQAERIKAIEDNRDQWEDRAEWYRGQYDRLVKIDLKYKKMSARINWVSISLGVLVGVLTGFTLVVYGGGLAFAVWQIVLGVSGTAGVLVAVGIQLLFRLT